MGVLKIFIYMIKVILDVVENGIINKNEYTFKSDISGYKGNNYYYK